MYINIEEFKNKVPKTITVNNDQDEVFWEFTDGTKYRMYHERNCCESVGLESGWEDLQVLIGQEILSAEEKTNSEDTFGKIEYPDSFTWTFYTIRTLKDTITLTWLGESNGYCSEDVCIVKN